MAHSYPIKGIPTKDNHRPPVRRDIDEWYREQADRGRSNGIQLTLFVQALREIQKRPVTDQLSYFRLAGIHSAPWCAWDGEFNPPVPSSDRGQIPGFCVHNNYTFPTWHRVYMLLYEQVIHQAMHDYIDKSGKVPERLKKVWRDEADVWRLPYWDFARNATRPPGISGDSGDLDDDRLRLPILCMMPTIRTIAYKNGDIDYETGPNPVYKFETPRLMGDLPEPYKIIEEYVAASKDYPEFTYPWHKCTATTKYGILDGYHESVWSDGGQNWLRANYALNEHSWYDKDWIDHQRPVPTLQDMVYRLFQYGLDNWGAFATTRYEKDKKPRTENPKNAMSLEFIHNNVHNWVGGTQFLRPDENNIHLWGAGHMSSVFMAAFDPIFFFYHCNIDRLTAIWQVLNPDLWFDDEYSQPTRESELAPFHIDDQHKLYKSDDVQCWRGLHYEYEILQRPKPKEGEPWSERAREDILKDIAELYGAPTKELYGRLPEPGGSQEDYVITVIYDKFALNGSSYKINIFLGDPSKKSYTGHKSENFVASVYNFSGSLASSGCNNCHQQKADGVMCIAQVPATVPVRHYVDKNKVVPEPVYVALNSLGKPVQMEVTIQLDRSDRSYFKHPIAPVAGDPLEYQPVKEGRQAEGIFE